MGFDIVKFLSEVVLSMTGKDGASNASILIVLIFIAVTQIIKIRDKRKELKKEKLKKEEELNKKKVSIYRMGDHEERISIVLEKMLNKLYDRNVLRACVMQISNGGEFINNVKLLKLHMTYEERVNTRVDSIRDRYNQVMINGKYDKLFAKICTIGSCFFSIVNEDTLAKDFVDDPDTIIYMHILYGNNGYPIGIAMVGFSELDKNLEAYVHNSLYNHIVEIENILKS